MKIKKYISIFILLLLVSCSPKDNKSNSTQNGDITPSSNTTSSELIKKALEVRENAYCPYSNYKVGSAIKTAEGKIYVGTNVENAAYGSTICAERAALLSAISAGSHDINTIVVVTKDGGSPCGSCRQMLNEFNPEIEVIMADESGKIKDQTSLSKLLPNAFGPKNLSK